MSAYASVVKTSLLEGLTYRFEIVSGVATRLVLMGTAVYLWRAAFSGVAERGGTTVGDMVRHAIISAVLGRCSSLASSRQRTNGSGAATSR